MLPAVEARSPNHWTARDVPPLILILAQEFGFQMNIEGGTGNVNYLGLCSRPSVSTGSVSTGSASSATEGRLYYTIFYKGLEHPWILVSAEVLEPMPAGSEGRWSFVPRNVTLNAVCLVRSCLHLPLSL